MVIDENSPIGDRIGTTERIMFVECEGILDQVTGCTLVLQVDGVPTGGIFSMRDEQGAICTMDAEGEIEAHCPDPIARLTVMLTRPFYPAWDQAARGYPLLFRAYFEARQREGWPR